MKAASKSKLVARAFFLDDSGGYTQWEDLSKDGKERAIERIYRNSERLLRYDYSENQHRAEVGKEVLKLLGRSSFSECNS